MDQSTPVAKDRYLMEPMILTGLLQSAASGPSDIIPDIACGTGNAVAMLARLAENVVGLESDEALVAQGNQVLTDLGVDNAVVVLSDLNEGYAKQGPYNLIRRENRPIFTNMFVSATTCWKGAAEAGT